MVKQGRLPADVLVEAFKLHSTIKYLSSWLMLQANKNKDGTDHNIETHPKYQRAAVILLILIGALEYFILILKYQGLSYFIQSLIMGIRD